MSVKSSDAAATRERQPFKIVDADGHTTELTYSSPHPAADHDEQQVLDELPWFDAGQPLHNWMLHDSDRRRARQSHGACARSSSS